MSGPTTDNKIIDVLNGVINALMSGGVAAAETYLTALDPAVLAVPIIAWLMDEGLQWLGQIISVAGQKFADNLAIDVQTNGEKSQVINAGVAIILANGSGEQDAINAAVKEASDAYKKAFNFDGWATISK